MHANQVKIAVWVPTYSSASGGNIILHKMASLLKKIGYDAQLAFPLGGNSPHDIPKADINNLKDFLVIYPEVVQGNPFNADRVLRWLLYYPGGHGIPFNPAPTDYLATLTPVFHDSDVITVFETFPDIFNNPGLPRDGGCFVVHKGKNKKRIPETDGLLEITDLGAEHCASIFKTKKIFYCYDCYCILSLAAALCGCISVVIPNEGLSKEDWIKGEPYMKYGVAYGVDDIAWSEQTMGMVKDYLDTFDIQAVEQIKNVMGKIFGSITY